MKVFEGDADAPGLGRAVRVRGRVTVPRLIFGRVAAPDEFLQLGDAVLFDVGVVVEEVVGPLEEAEARGFFQGWGQPLGGLPVEVALGEVEGDVLVVR